MMNKPFQPFKADLSIGEVYNTSNEGHIEIKIEDRDSGCQIVSVKLDHATFAQALFSHAHLKCEGEILRDIQKIGQTHEYK